MKIILKTYIISLLPPNRPLIHDSKTLSQTFLKTLLNLQNNSTKTISLHKNIFYVELIATQLKWYSLVQNKFVLDPDVGTSGWA